MQPSDLKERSKKLALRAIKLVEALPHNPAGWVVGKQLLRSATSVAANYRAVCRSRSDAEFVAKMGTVIEEADETCFWLELLVESEIMPKDKLDSLQREADELIRIFATSRTTVVKRMNSSLRNSNQKSKIENQK